MLFITIYLFILLKVSIAKIKKEGAQNIIFDLNMYFRNKQIITPCIIKFSKILDEHCLISDLFYFNT